jgi:hypothetical protein
MNSHILKIVGESELPEALDLGKDYLISINAGITKISKKSDEEGGFIFSYQAKQRTCEVLKDNGEILKTKDKSKQSPKTRAAILATRNDFMPELEEEDYYILIQKGIRANLGDIINLILKSNV